MDIKRLIIDNKDADIWDGDGKVDVAKLSEIAGERITRPMVNRDAPGVTRDNVSELVADEPVVADDAPVDEAPAVDNSDVLAVFDGDDDGDVDHDDIIALDAKIADAIGELNAVQGKLAVLNKRREVLVSALAKHDDQPAYNFLRAMQSAINRSGTEHKDAESQLMALLRDKLGAL